MEYLAPIGTVTVIHLLAVISPGPDFIMACRNSLTYSRKTGIWTAIGFGGKRPNIVRTVHSRFGILKNWRMIWCYNNNVMNKMTLKKIRESSINQAVENSSKIEGLSFLRAKKNTLAIKLLKQHGRAFSI